MDKDTNHLLRQYGIALFFGGLTLFGLIASILRGEYRIPSVVALVLLLVLGQVWFTKRKVAALFRNPTAEQAVAYYRGTVSKLPNGRAFSAYMSGLALALYGEFDKARDELSQVSWSGLPPMYEGFRTHVLTVIAILQEKNCQKASELAAETRDLCSTDPAVPGGNQSRDASLSRLDNAVRSLPDLAKLIPAWALARYYSAQGDAQRAATYSAVVKKIAPHCAPLKI